jgi:hypothetical protein
LIKGRGKGERRGDRSRDGVDKRRWRDTGREIEMEMEMEMERVRERAREREEAGPPTQMMKHDPSLPIASGSFGNMPLIRIQREMQLARQ